jgi:hypothetical protein
MGRNFRRRAVTCLVTVGVRQPGPRDIKEIMATCRDSTNLVNLVASYREHVVPGSCLVICHLTEMATLVETGQS